ncbi:MAG TPA: carboxypeptidase-like regulatory domain-containing protein [Bryobacteraceae bacterium]|nr:carboxypeptidase-like regulatory domain-containing protein [Bryobacteraceae bacterium]
MRLRSVFLALLIPVSLPGLLAQTASAPLAVVEGDVLNASSNAALPGARVKLQPLPQNEDAIYGKVDAQGHFVFRHLNPGSYQLVIDAPGFHESRSRLDVTVPQPPRRDQGVVRAAVSYRGSQIPEPKVTRTAEDDGTIHATVTAPMLAYSAISGKVTDPYGAPLAGANIELWKTRPPNFGMAAPSPGTSTSSAMRQNNARADSRGQYRLTRLEPGTYWIAVSKSSLNWIWQTGYRATYYPAALDLSSAQALKIEPGEEFHADIQVLKQSGVSLSGQLLGLPAGKMLSTRMTLVPADRESSEVPFTQGQDRFAFTDLLPGRYTLYAVTEDDMSDPMNPHRKPLFGAVRDVEIGKQDNAGFDITLEPAQTLHGKVEVPDGCSTVPASIQLRRRSRLGLEVESPIAADGTFTIENVPADRFAIQLSPGLPLISATKGARDVLKDGLEAPWHDDEALKIKASCPNRGVPR